MITFLPSPAPSACDSLAGIDDLDAFLEAQGQLSHWPTPPKESGIVEVTEVGFGYEDDRRDSQVTVTGVEDVAGIEDKNCAASLLVEVAGAQISTELQDVEAIRRILLRAKLPREIVAIALNILSALESRLLPSDPGMVLSSELLVVAAFTLASAYTSDHPPSYTHWSQRVCNGNWTAAEIDRTALNIMSSLGWRLHDLSSASAIDEALSRLDHYIPVSPTKLGEATVGECDVTGSNPILPRLCVNGTNISWVNGQLTPEETPTTVVVVEDRYLKLL
jgi:hypothetical protein